MIRKTWLSVRLSMCVISETAENLYEICYCEYMRNMVCLI
jgi:hypothetical protein